MNILYITHIFPPATDGGSKIIAKIAHQLSIPGNNTLVLTSNCLSTDDFINPKSITINLSSPNVIRLPVYHFHHRLPKPFFKILPFVKTLYAIKNFHPDLIVAGPFPTLIIIYALILKHIFHTKLCLIPCFHQFDKDFSQKHLIAGLNHADIICTLTQHEFDYLHFNFKIPQNKLFTMHAGVDKTFLKPIITKSNFTKNTILFLGNFSAHKRVELLIHAFSKLAIKNLKLVLCGQKTLYWPQIQKVIDSQPKNIKKNIAVHLKNYNTSELSDYLDNSSILVLPSIHESFGLVFVEAMARGIPVIGADIPPVSELLKSTGGGLIFEKDNLDDLTSKIHQLISNSDLYKKLSVQGLNYVVKHLTWDKIGNQLWEKLQKC